jgi:hypothetical protein
MSDRRRLETLLRSLDDREQKQLPDDDSVLIESEMCRMCRVSRWTALKWRKQGTGPPFMRLTQTRYAYRLGDVRRWLRARTEQPALNKEVARGDASTAGHETKHQGKHYERAFDTPPRDGL